MRRLPPTSIPAPSGLRSAPHTRFPLSSACVGCPLSPLLRVPLSLSHAPPTAIEVGAKRIRNHHHLRIRSGAGERLRPTHAPALKQQALSELGTTKEMKRHEGDCPYGTSRRELAQRLPALAISEREMIIAACIRWTMPQSHTVRRRRSDNERVCGGGRCGGRLYIWRKQNLEPHGPDGTSHRVFCGASALMREATLRDATYRRVAQRRGVVEP